MSTTATATMTVPTPSKSYISLETTALAFIDAQRRKPSIPTLIDFPQLNSLVSPTYTHTFGHTFAVSLAPPLQGAFDIKRFTAHLQAMLPNLESWDLQVTDVVVDDVKRKVVVRVGYVMRLKAVEEEVINDVLWVLEVDDEGKVGKSVEILDGVAARRLKELILARK